MKTAPAKAIVVAPYWDLPGHVGHFRAERFVRWLSQEGTQVIVLAAGQEDSVSPESWGAIVTIAEPFGLYRRSQGPATSGGTRRGTIRNKAASVLFSPDPTIIWAKRCAAHELTKRWARGVDVVLSSSPPESAHVTSSAIAQTTGSRLVVDLRDGWLDEPLRWVLAKYRWRQWLEGRLEERILGQADLILVTSDVWSETLSRRLPSTAARVRVLTNGYQQEAGFEIQSAPQAERELHLLYAGRLTGSRSSQKLDYLLRPLEGAIPHSEPGRIEIIGAMTSGDLEDIEVWNRRLSESGWRIETRTPVPHPEALDRMKKASGLLLLCVSPAPLPCKVFDYLSAKRPILAVTPRGSALWRVGEVTRSIFLADPEEPEAARESVHAFLDVCSDASAHFEAPPDYSDEALSRTFWKALSEILPMSDAEETSCRA